MARVKQPVRRTPPRRQPSPVARRQRRTKRVKAEEEKEPEEEPKLASASSSSSASFSSSSSSSTSALAGGSGGVQLPATFFDDHLRCSICLDVVSAPVQAVPCAHVFCEPCLWQYFATAKKTACPNCRGAIDMVVHPCKATLALLEMHSATTAITTTTTTTSTTRKKSALKKNVPLLKHHAALFGEEEEEEESSDSSSDSDGEEDETTTAATSDMVRTFVALTGAPEAAARATIEGALSRGLTLDHAVEYHLSGAGVTWQ